MTDSVLDASAVLALIHGEPGSTRVRRYLLGGASVSAVNLSEVVAKLQERGIAEDVIRSVLDDLPLTIVDFTASTAYRAGLLRSATRPLGLAFGDRACLAVAAERQAVAVTTDAAWSRLALGVTVDVIR